MSRNRHRPAQLFAALSVLAIASANTGRAEALVHYEEFGIQTGIPLEETGKNFKFVLAANGDLFVIKQSETGTASTELHVLSAASDYQQFVRHTGTPIEESGPDYTFLLSGGNDLYAIKKFGTSSEMTELTVLSAKSGYTEVVLQTSTALHETDDTFEFQLALNDDLIAIKKSDAATRSTEVHVLTAASGYQQFSVQTGTPLPETDRNTTFVLARNRDLVAIKKNHTKSGKTEVEVLSAADNYQRLSLSAATALHETDGTFAFMMQLNRDLVAIKKRDTGTGSTEVHVLQY